MSVLLKKYIIALHFVAGNGARNPVDFWGKNINNIREGEKIIVYYVNDTNAMVHLNQIVLHILNQKKKRNGANVITGELWAEDSRTHKKN
jgi:hypothetical protein